MAHVFEWGKLSKCHFKGKTNRKWVNGLKIYDSEKGWSATTPGEYMYITKYSKAFFSETIGPIKAKRQVELPYSLYKWSYNQDGRHGYN